MADEKSGSSAGQNWLAYSAPEAAAEMMRTQNRMAIAQALMQKGMEPMPAFQMAGNVAIKASPLQGLANMLGTYAGSQALTGRGPGNLPDQYMRAQSQMYAQALANNQQPSRTQQALGMGAQTQPNQTLPQGSPTPAAEPGIVQPQAQGGQYNMGGIGPTNANAALASGQAPIDPTHPTDEDLAGFLGQPVGRVAMERLMGTKDYYTAVMEYQKLVPPEVRKAQIAGMDPRSVTQQTIAKDLTMSGRQGSYIGNPVVGFTQLPTSEGTQNVMGPDGRWHTGLTPEATNVQSALGYSQQAGKTGATMQQGVDKFGNPAPMFVSPPPNPYVSAQPQNAGSASSAVSATVAPKSSAVAPKSSAPSTAVWTPPYGGNQGTRLGLSAQELADRELGAKHLDSARVEASNVGLFKELLASAKLIAENPNNKFGIPGAEDVANLKAAASHVGIDMTDAKTARDVLSKIQSQIVSSQLGSGGTDRQLENLLHGVPGKDMTNTAILQVIQMLESQLDLKENRAAFAQHIADSTKLQQNVPSALTTYNRLADPATITLGKQIAEAEAAGKMKQFMSGLTPAQKALLPRVSKLGQLGAF